jgi:hypothetical protein
MKNSIRTRGDHFVNLLLTTGYSCEINGHPFAYREGISAAYNYAQLAGSLVRIFQNIGTMIGLTIAHRNFRPQKLSWRERNPMCDLKKSLCSMLMACCLIGGLATAFAPTPLLAQSVSGEITGSVTDPTGAAIANAQVVATHVVTGVTTTAITNSSGLYTFSELPSGTYDVTVTSSGFSTSVLKGVLVELNHVVSENIEMKPASASTNVEVVADAGVTVDTVSSQLQTTYDTKEVTDLPLAASGLGVLNLSLLSPGVGSSGGTGIGTGPAIGGQRPQNNDFTLEGVDDNDKTVSGPMVLVNPDSVAEFSLLTNVYSAEFGHSDAGHFNTVVRTGTNKFHGRVYEYFQNRNMNAVDTFDAIGNAPGTTKNPRFDNNLFGGGVGGPIIKDKLFFYADYERNPVGQTGGTDQLCVPTAAGVATLGTIPGISATNLSILTKYAPVATAYPSINCGTDVNNNLITSINVGPSGTPVQVGGYTLIAGSFLNKDFLTTAVDYHLSDRDQFRFRYIYNLDDGPDTAAAIPVFWGTAPIRDHLASISYFHTLTPSLLNEACLGYLRNFSKLDAPFPAEFPGLRTFPNAGDHDFVTENLFQHYSEGVGSFFVESADHFAAHSVKDYEPAAPNQQRTAIYTAL